MALITPYWGLDGILIFASLIVSFYIYMTRNFKYWAKRGVMEFTPTPFIGNFGECLMMKKPAHAFIKELYQASKGLPYMGFYIFDKPFFLIRDPELVKHVLVKDFNVFNDRYTSPDVNDRIGYASLFTMKNPAWKILRTKLTPVFTSGKLKKIFELEVQIAQELDRFLETQDVAGNGKVMEIRNLCQNLTTDMIGSTAFGLQVNSLFDDKAPFRVFGRKMFELSFSRGLEFTSIFFMPHLTKYIRAKFFGKFGSEFLRHITWEVINQRIASGEKRGDLIDILIELKQQHEKEGDLGGFTFSGDDLVAQAATFFTAGFETSASTMAFSLYELALNKEVQDTLRKEVLQALEDDGGKVKYDTVMTLPYLDMVTSETLRKYPPLAFLDRVTGTNYKVPNSDLVLPKGTPVYISISGIQSDPEYFPDPDKYDPERFTEENKKLRPSFTYFPFGEGPHNCIGFRLGLMQAKLGVYRFISKYEVSPCEKTQVPIQLDPKAFLMIPSDGLYLNVRKAAAAAH